MDKSTQKQMKSSKSIKWRTPEVFEETLNKLTKIGLDPCGHPRTKLHALKQYLLSQGEDGLKKSWRGRGLVFVNPPYGRDKKRKNKPRTLIWLLKALREIRKDPTMEIVFLIAARMDSGAFQDIVFKRAQAVCYWRGRMKFHGKTKSGKLVGALFPSAVVYFGPRPKKFKAAFEGKGHVDFLTVPKIHKLYVVRGENEKAA